MLDALWGAEVAGPGQRGRGSEEMWRCRGVEVRGVEVQGVEVQGVEVRGGGVRGGRVAGWGVGGGGVAGGEGAGGVVAGGDGEEALGVGVERGHGSDESGRSACARGADQPYV